MSLLLSAAHESCAFVCNQLSYKSNLYLMDKFAGAKILLLKQNAKFLNKKMWDT